MNDTGTSGPDDCAARGHRLDPFFRGRRALRLCVGACHVALLCLTAASAATWNPGVSGTSGALFTRRQIFIKANTFPDIRTIYVFSAYNNSFLGRMVGPGQPDILISAGTEPYDYPLRNYATYSVGFDYGSHSTGSIPEALFNVQVCLTAQALSSGPVQSVNCTMPSVDFEVTQTRPNFDSNIYYYLPPVYISFYSHEGQEGLLVDNGSPADNDDDGIPDSMDPDDDNDGRPDTDDAFPFDPNEKDDFDHDGIGDNADPDDDNDGYNDDVDGEPYNPDLHFKDTDGDGVEDKDDAFPNNARESKDSDGDGVGDNTDPTPHSPGTGPLSGQPQGDGNGNAGVGNGSGQPGPVPSTQGQPGTGEGTVGTPDTSGEVKPDARHDVAGAAGPLGPAIEGKIGNLKPVVDSPIGRISSYDMTFSLARYGTRTVTIKFDEAPWTYMRATLLVVMILLIGSKVLRKLQI